MATTVKIDVTQADIDAGEKGDCGKCPIALAVDRAIPGAINISVGDDMIVFQLSGGYNGVLIGETPKVAVDFIGLFDEGCRVQPFSFDLTYSA